MKSIIIYVFVFTMIMSCREVPEDLSEQESNYTFDVSLEGDHEKFITVISIMDDGDLDFYISGTDTKTDGIFNSQDLIDQPSFSIDLKNTTKASLDFSALASPVEDDIENMVLTLTVIKDGEVIATEVKVIEPTENQYQHEFIY